MTRAVALMVLAFAPAGCGTMENFGVPRRFVSPEPPPLEVYGGVSRSAAAVKESLAGGDLVDAPYAPLFAVDVALSAVGDTLTLPFTLAATVSRSIDAYYGLSRPEDDATRNAWRRFWFDERPPEPERIRGGIIEREDGGGAAGDPTLPHARG